MSKTEDASGERRVEWDKEIAAGNLVPKTALVRDTSDKSTLHVQGHALTPHEEAKRVVSAETMKCVMDTKRYPDPSGKKLNFGAPPGGWPQFDKKLFDDHGNRIS